VPYLDIPTPHGKAGGVYAEVMPDDHSSLDMDRSWQPWFTVADLFFVTGIERGPIMGEPVMSYRTLAAAEKAVVTSGGRVVTFEQLREANRQ
jgi:nitrous oxide reductase accessory protein NosL